MLFNIKTAAGRERLTPRRDPYFDKVAGKLYLGFRKMDDESAGTWIARTIDRSGERVFEKLGALPHTAPGHRYAEAKRLAEEWDKLIQLGGSSARKTVQSACDEYVQALRDGFGKHPPRPDAADQTKRRFDNTVKDSDLAGVDLRKLVPDDLTQWRNELKDVRGEPMSLTSKKRNLSGLRAALNHARKRYPGIVEVWSEPLKVQSSDDSSRDVYLENAQVKSMISAAEGLYPDLARLIRCMAITPIRPGALAKALVADFSPTNRTLSIKHDKTGAREISGLPDDLITLLKLCSKDKHPKAPLFTRSNGNAWTSNDWQTPIKRIVRKAGDLPDGTVIYSLRHTTITNLVRAGVDLITVAKMAGTSLQMIEKNYGKTSADLNQQAMAKMTALFAG